MPIAKERNEATRELTPTPSITGRESIEGGSLMDLRLDHFRSMMTDIGMWQHGKGRVPDRRHGYSIDDEVRALIVALRHIDAGHEVEFFTRVAEICFRFVENAAVRSGRLSGRFHNFCDEHGRWLDSVGSDDSFGRTVWALGVARGEGQNCVPADRVDALLERALPICSSLTPLRSKAFVILGLAEIVNRPHAIDAGLRPPGPQSWGNRTDVDETQRIDARAMMRALADSLADAYEQTADEDWRWFEDYMTYCNARLPHALFAAAQAFPSEERYARIAVETLDFLLQVTRNGKGGYAPIGNAPMASRHWYVRGDAHPPLFDQQPVDAGALVEACVAAYESTAEPRFRKAAYLAYGWYFGDNVHGLPVYDAETGGVCDALTPEGLNCNMGAESVLSIHLAAQALRRLE